MVTRARILLADGHDEMRERIGHQLEAEFDVVDSVTNGYELLEAAARLRPDLCLLDISLRIFDGIETAACLKRNGSNAKIVFLTMHEDTEFVRAALRIGASGYVVKRRMVSDLRPAINEALAGRTFVSTVLTSK